jgi:predicted dienelactone hydrolase
LVAAAGLAGLGVNALTGSGRARPSAPGSHATVTLLSTSASTATTTAAPRSHHRRRAPSPPFAVGLLTLRLVDHSRTITLPDGTTDPRTLVTYVRFPLVNGAGRFPLVVFGHGFAVTPSPYRALLTAWAGAGFVVAAPVFPLGNANAPGGPDERDLVNQPRDMSFVITQLLAASAAPGPLRGLINEHAIAVSGQSDGGDTAVAAAFDTPVRDPRIRAAVILSGAEIPGTSGYRFADGEPALLATQGTADTVNPPADTRAFFAPARRPKFLLQLLGASHLPPYTTEQPQLSIVERVTIAFLNRYLRTDRAAGGRLHSLADVAGVSMLKAAP